MTDLVPNLTLLRSYSAADDLVVRPPVVNHFPCDGRHLYFVNAHHEFGTFNPTADAIRHAFDVGKPRFLIMEGHFSALGLNAAEYLVRHSEWAKTGFATAGEGAFAVSLALQHDIPFQGGEPTDAELLVVARQHGYSSLDFVGYSLMLYVHQDLMAGLGQSEERWRALMAERLAKEFSFMPPAEIPNFDGLLGWLQLHHGSRKLTKVTGEDVSPYGNEEAKFMQRLTNSMTRARDEHLLRLIAARLNEYGRVLVVYGDGHLQTTRAVLEDMLGEVETV